MEEDDDEDDEIIIQIVLTATIFAEKLSLISFYSTFKLSHLRCQRQFFHTFRTAIAT